MIQGKDQARGKGEGGVRVKTERIGTLGKTLLGRRRTNGNKSLMEERGCEKQEQGKIETSESRKRNRGNKTKKAERK